MRKRFLTRPKKRIPIDEAKRIINNYKNLADDDKFKTKVDANSEALLGFVFAKQDLIDILNKNPGVDKVVMALAYHDDSIPTIEEGYTLVMLGMDEIGSENRLMIIPGVHAAFDYCEPIPPATSSPALDSQL